MHRCSGLAATYSFVLIFNFACGSDERGPPGSVAGAGSQPSQLPAAGSAAQAAAPSEEPDTSLCAKYGGMQSVRQVTAELLGRITGDCRIRSFFAGLTAAGGARVLDCLSLQIGELFACPGVSYAQAHAENGLECRDMRKSHIGLGITAADFDALVQDVGQGLAAAGIDAADIEAAASSLSALAPHIVEVPESSLPSRSECELVPGLERAE